MAFFSGRGLDYALCKLACVAAKWNLATPGLIASENLIKTELSMRFDAEFKLTVWIPEHSM